MKWITQNIIVYTNITLCTIHVPRTSDAIWATISEYLMPTAKFTFKTLQHGCY